MRRTAILTIPLMFIYIFCNAQQDAAEAVMRFMGAESVEVLDPYDLERFEKLLRNPLKINVISISSLEESGLMTHYQAVSLADYISRHGDVMSLSELACVDGFGREYVFRIAPFISLESFRLPSERRKGIPDMRHEISARTGARSGRDLTYGFKYCLDTGERLEASVSVSRTADSNTSAPDALSGNIMWRFRKVDGVMILGDYNARFGQGLALWNGMSLGGVPAPSSLMKRPSGISGSSSYTGKYSMRGVAGSLSFRKVKVSAMMDISSSENGFNLFPGVNTSFYFRNGQVSVTHYSDMSITSQIPLVTDMKTSVDYSACYRGKDFFSEAAYDWKSSSVAVLGGCVVPAGDDVRVGVMARLYPPEYNSTRSAALRSSTRCSNEYSLALSTEFFSGEWVTLTGREGFSYTARRHSGVVSVDAAVFPESKEGAEHASCQMKSRADWTVNLSGSWNLKFRFLERIRSWGNPFRTEFRTDLAYDTGMWLAVLRINVVKCVGWSCLSYAELGHEKYSHALHCRAGFFCADDWEDRLYAYERDAPGSFNVPAYYGRGVWAAIAFRWRFSRCGKVYLRAAATSYALMEEEKPGKAELKLQFELDL